MVASKNKARLILITTFALGALTGALAMNLFQIRSQSQQPGTGGRNGRGPGLVEELAKEIRLDPQQRNQVEQILTDTRTKYTELQKQMQPQFSEIRNATRAQIRALLRPDQQALYDEWNRKRDAKHKQKRAVGAHAPPKQ
jgi:Spy/CpxP family protein refolding chaperone